MIIEISLRKLLVTMQKINFSITMKDYISLLPPDCPYSVIFSNTGSIWAISDGWTFTEEDAKRILALIEDPVTAMKSSFVLGQRSYLVVYADGESLVARNREFGVFVIKCKISYLLGYCDGTTDPTQCLRSVRRIATLTNQSKP